MTDVMPRSSPPRSVRGSLGWDVAVAGWRDESEGAVLAGRYRVERVLGRGGFATVYEATDEQQEVPVAVKIVRRSTDRVDRFEREVVATTRIDDPNVCAVLDVGVLPDGRPYLVMPLLLGMPLRKLLEMAAPLPQPLTLSIADQVLGALEAAHAAGVVHRDLKPENVFLLDGKQPHFVKVLDFGIARLVGGDPQMAGTATGQAVGTANYMAPEQARGQRDQDARVDVWAVGVLLYEMLTATRPFEGDSYGETLARLLFDPFPPPRTRRPDLSPEVEEVVLRALQRDREQRYDTARSMRAALAGLVPEETPTRPPRITHVTVEQPVADIDEGDATIVEPPRDEEQE